MTAIRVVIPGPPVPKARPRFGGRGSKRVYTPEKTANYEAAVSLYARRAMEGEQPYDCPIEMRVQFVFEPPVSWTKQKATDASQGLVECTNALDLDNLIKAIGDACNNIIYLDDRQIIRIDATKAWGRKSFTLVEFTPRIRARKEMAA